MPDRHQVIVIGGGFGGVAVTKGLKRADVEVTLADRTNHHLFQPLLYQVAAGILSEGTIAPPLRGVIRRQQNARVVLGELTRFDLENHLVSGVAPDGRTLQRRYDTLVVAAGVRHDYFGHDEWEKYAPGMKTIEDARRLRSDILAAFELAETVSDPADRAALLTFVVIGAGPTGVELVGQIAELARRVLPREFRWLDTRAEVRVILVEAGPAVLAPFHKKLRDYTKRRLEKIGVEVRLGTMATDLDADGITVKSAERGEERIACRTKIWAAGVHATPLATMLAEAAGVDTDRAGRLLVNDNCTLPGHPEVFAIGDMVSLQGLPGVAQPAIQEGKYVARVIRARLDGEQDDDLEPFRYFDKGSMATIGWNSAVAGSRGVRFTGFIGFAMWALVHVMYLVGWGNRFVTMSSWLRSMVFTHNRGERIITAGQVQTTTAEPQAPLP
jgi:NADH dehydrogenase